MREEVKVNAANVSTACNDIKNVRREMMSTGAHFFQVANSGKSKSKSISRYEEAKSSARDLFLRYMTLLSSDVGKLEKVVEQLEKADEANARGWN